MAESIFYPLNQGISSFFGGIFRRFFQNNPQQGGQLFQSWLTGNKAPIWIDTNDLMRVFTTSAHLQLVINRGAEMFKNADIKVYKIGDENPLPDQTHPVLKLLKKPNPIQSHEIFLSDYYRTKKIYDNAFLYCPKNLSSPAPFFMYNLPPQFMKVVGTGLNIYAQKDLKGIVEKYILCIGGKDFFYSPDDTIHISSGIGNNPLVSDSKILGLKKPISNIDMALQIFNSAGQQAGTFVATNAAKDAMGTIPFAQGEKERVEADMGLTHGVGDNQRKYRLSASALSITPLSYPVNDLLPHPEIEQDFGIICDTFDIDRDCFSSTKGATNENKSMGEKRTYQNAMQPEMDGLLRTLSDRFGLTEQGLELRGSYKHLSCMQGDKVKEATARKVTAEACSIMLRDGIIDKDEYAEECEVEGKGDGVIVQNTAPKIPPTA